MKSKVVLLLRVLNQFRQLDLNIHVKTAIVFCVVAVNEGMQVKEIGEKAGIHDVAASRAVSFLLQQKMIETREQLTDRRAKEVYLTQKGRLFINHLDELLDKDS